MSLSSSLSRFPATALVLLSILIPAFASVAAATGDWPQWRGPAQDGRSLASGVFAAGFGLEIAWKRSLGQGYSSISIANGHVLTMYSDGQRDLLVSFATASGEEQWRFDLGATYPGHHGSTDGPLATPTIANDTVYALGPYGLLAAVNLADGKLKWSAELGSQPGSKAPFYGYSTTPLVERGVVIVQAGGDQGGVSAFAAIDGKKLWSRGGNRVGHQSPLLWSIGGKRQLLAVAARELQALDIETGQLLWSHLHSAKGSESYPQAVPLGDDKLLLSFEDKTVLTRIAADTNTEAKVVEVWESSALKNSFAVPVLHEGHLYGFNGRFLVCVEAASGREVWKSRPPGGQGLILVDGHLVIFASKGIVTLVEATPRGYTEKASIEVSNEGSYTPPSFAAGQIFVRNQADLVSVRITSATNDSATP